VKYKKKKKKILFHILGTICTDILILYTTPTVGSPNIFTTHHPKSFTDVSRISLLYFMENKIYFYIDTKKTLLLFYINYYVIFCVWKKPILKCLDVSLAPNKNRFGSIL